MDDATVRPSNPLERAISSQPPPLPTSEPAAPPSALAPTPTRRAKPTATTTTASRLSFDYHQGRAAAQGRRGPSSPSPSPTMTRLPRSPASPTMAGAAPWRSPPQSPTLPHSPNSFSSPSVRPPASRRNSSSPTLVRGSGGGGGGGGHPHAQSIREQPREEDLEKFEDLCRRLYYDKDPTAARQVDQTLAKLPAGFRTTYARAMATIRTAFHRDEEIRRRREVEQILATCEPAATIKAAIGVSPHSDSVPAMRSAAARQARGHRLKAFVQANCVEAMPGTHPFFRGLFAALWVQANQAEARCVEWEVDVAVFTEAGSGDAWARDAVEILKGALGMSERIKSQAASTYADSTRTSRLSSARSETSSVRHSQPVMSSATTAPVVFERPAKKTSGPPPPVPPHRGSSARHRAPSDPFLDNKAPQSDVGLHAADEAGRVAIGSTPSSTSLLPLPSPISPLAYDGGLSSPTASTPFLLSTHAPASLPTTPLARSPLGSTSHRPIPTPAVAPEFRVFTLPPYLTNPELHELLRLFPSFIGAPVRRAAASAITTHELETKVSAVVHGDVSNGSAGGGGGGGASESAQYMRNAGWKGTLWQRFVLWLMRLFRLA
ncbi:hypothetical protein BMF94_1245 [Rhodotorula taiwanensis]|uniref:Uncharacterized protein n=1 Tax=Rhodotorula taiwanensis TaxID=741276 RepID=A0A2S5BFU8_9BASI|nr:hypothetical protein BMF94_1245 [Rhodotorula taiwanensis]